ncbi:MAG: ABC transporter substrate-binding protein, partial [bacterium]
IGGFCSSESLAAVPIATVNKIVLFSASSSSPDLTNISKYFFRNYPSDASQGAVLAQIAFDKGYKKIAFIQEQLDYPLGIFKAFDNKFKELGGSIVKEEFATSVTDFRSQLLKLKVEAPNALFIDSQTPAVSQRILRQLGQSEWKPPLFLTDATIGDSETLQKYSGQLEGAMGAEFGVDLNNSKFKSLSESYKQKYNTDLPYASYAQTEYDVVYMLRDAINENGYNPSKIVEWVRSVKDWSGASGLVIIGADGDRVGGHVAKVVKNGKVELYIK